MERSTCCSSTIGISSTIVKQVDGSNIFRQHARSVNPFSVSPQLPWWSCSGDATTMPHRNPEEKPRQRGHAQSLFSPPSLFPPPGGLISATGSRSESVMVGDISLSICGGGVDTVSLQMPVANPFLVAHGGQPWLGLAPPPSSSVISMPSSISGTVAVGYSSDSIHGHVAMSQSLPSSFFPVHGMVDLQASAATPFPAALGGQLWQGMAPPPSSGLFSEQGSRSGSAAVGGSHGHVTTSQSLPSSFSCTLGMVDLQAPQVSPFPGPLGDLPWQVLRPPPSRADLGLPACPNAFSGLAGQSAASGQMAAWPQSEMPFFSPPAAASGQSPPPSSNANCVGFAQPPSSNYELPPLPPSLRIPPMEEASTYSTQLSTIGGGTMPWHYAGSSMAAGSSIPGVPNLSAGAMKMKAPMPPLEEASTFSSMGTGGSIPAVPNLTAAGDIKMKAPMPPPPPPPPHGVVGGGSSSNFTGFVTAKPSVKSELAALRAGLQAHLLPVKQEPGLDQDAVHQHSMPDNSTDRGLVSWDDALKMPVVESIRYNGSGTKVLGSTPYCHNSNSTTLKLWQPLPLPPSSFRAGASSSQSHVIFTDAEKEMIRKDKSMQELVSIDPKKAKRTLLNRMSAAKRKAARDKRILELLCKVETLERKRETLSAQLQVVQEKRAELQTHNKEICMMVQELEQQSMLKDAVTETKKAEIQNLNNIIKLNMQRNN